MSGDGEGGSNRRSTTSTVLVMACTAASRLFGFVRQALFSYYFGASGAADAMNAVFNIPNTLRKLFAEGAFSSAFIPVLSTTLAEDASGGRARELVRTLVALQLLVLLPVVLLSLVFPRLFVDLLLEFSDPDKVEVATRLVRWMVNYVLLVGLSALCMAALNTHGKFALPALSPLAFTAASVLALVFFHGNMGIIAMGVGVLVGGLLQLGCQLPALRRQGYRFLPSFRFRNADFRKTAALWLPYLASSSISAVTQFAAQFFASGLEDGSVSAIANSVMFLQIPVGIFTTSVMTVTFPRMSRQAASEDREGLRATLSYGIESLLVLLVPSTILLCLFGREIIAATMQRGEFGPSATLMASRALAGYAIGLVFMGVYTLFLRLFSAMKSLTVPLLGAGCVAVVDIATSLILKETPLRVAGLAYANSIAFGVGTVVLGVLARRRIGSVPFPPILTSLGRSVIGCLPMTVLLFAFQAWKPHLWKSGGSMGATGLIAAVVAVCIGLTVLAYTALRVPFLTDIARRRRSARE